MSFQRTPTAVPSVAELPLSQPPSPPSPPSPTPQASPALPQASSPVPPRPPSFAGAPPPPPSSAAARQEPAPKRAEVLSSIGELDALPVPPPAPRKAAASSVAQPALGAELAGFWIRVAAVLLDLIPLLLLAAIGFALAFFVAPELALLFSIVQIAYGVALAIVFPALKGTTPGKKLLKLAIVSETTTAGQGLGWATALLRFVGHMVCSLTFSLGYLLVAFTAQKQGLHDLIAKTRVVRLR